MSASTISTMICSSVMSECQSPSARAFAAWPSNTLASASRNGFGSMYRCYSSDMPTRSKAILQKWRTAAVSPIPIVVAALLLRHQTHGANIVARMAPVAFSLETAGGDPSSHYEYLVAPVQQQLR
jgi:hypothetical protein